MFVCIKPACDALDCCGCNRALPERVYEALKQKFQEAERERCARVCEALTPKEPNCVWEAAYKAVGEEMAAAIRQPANYHGKRTSV